MFLRSSLPILLLCLFPMFEIGNGIEKEALIDIANINNLEIPWMWVASSAEEKAPQFVEVIDVIKKDIRKEKKENGLGGSSSKSQPRFIGNLKNKLCKVGLGIGRSYSACLDDANFLTRVKRSPQQFVKGDSEVDQQEVDQQDVDQVADAITDKENPETRLFGLNGFDGLTNLLKPSIDPSVGLYFGNPFYNGAGGGSKGPFQLDLGPISVNPFGQLRFTLHNGRPVIRPSVDFLVSSNKKGAHLHPEYEQYPEYLQTPLHPPHYQSPQYIPQIPISQYPPPYYKTQHVSPYIKKPKYPNYFPTSQYAQPSPNYHKSLPNSHYLPLYEDRNARDEVGQLYESQAHRDNSYGYPPSSSNKGYIAPDTSKFQFPTLLNNEQSYGYPPSSSGTVFHREDTIKQHTTSESFKKTFGYPPSTSNTEFRPSAQFKHQSSLTFQEPQFKHQSSPTFQEPQFKHQSSPTFEGPQPPTFSSFLAARDSFRDDRDEIFSQKEK